ncbi:MAG: hypothetical protein HYW91_01335 [Candidatus Sungbacteria bacterium]|nr:hypothetical protein [Candidatus Sungbacteria bacterium]
MIRSSAYIFVRQDDIAGVDDAEVVSQSFLSGSTEAGADGKKWAEGLKKIEEERKKEKKGRRK